MKTILLDVLYSLNIFIMFAGAGLSLFWPRYALTILRLGLIALVVLYFPGTTQTLLFGIGLANAFNPRSGGYGLFLMFQAPLVVYYLFALVTSFSRLPSRPWIIAMHFVVAPLAIIFQSSAVPEFWRVGERLSVLLCFVLVWLRIYDLRQRVKEHAQGSMEAPCYPEKTAHQASDPT